MASVCRDVALLVMAVLCTSAHAQETARPTVRKSIANPDFPCGVPWGPNGERPEEPRRVARQIIFPDEKEYKTYWAILVSKKKVEKVPDNLGRVGEGTDPLAKISVDEIQCGTSVISDRFLITAAHCVTDEERPIHAVRLGDIDLNSDNEENAKPVDYDIQGIIVHPKYKSNTKVRYYDIALLFTYDKIQFNDVVFPLCVSSEVPAPGTSVTTAGFGYYNATDRPTHLLEGDFKVMDTAECEDIYRRELFEPSLRLKYPDLLQNSDIICATDNVTDACQGDSGGPLFRDFDGRRYLEAIVGSGPSCKMNHKSVLPGLYISVANHIRFISHHVFNPPPDPPAV